MNDEQEVLRQGFAAFVAAARELESSYAELKARTAAIDLELQQTNRALEHSLRERDAVFSALPIGLVALRRDGSLATRNPEAQRLCELAVAAGHDLLAARAGEVLFADVAVRVQRIELPDGELLLFEDRSRLQQLERQVRRLDRLAGLSELALGIAHEIKNPLNGVKGFAALLERSTDTADMRRFASRIVAGVTEVDDIVKALLGFANKTGQSQRVARVADIVAEAASAAGLPRQRLEFAGERDQCADADALGRVLVNLLRNAREAAPDVRVRITAAARRGAVELVVQDDGPGVPGELAARVFEPFVSTKARGTGLGLALSARVLAYLGGELELLNPGEPGARFRVRIPAVDGAAPIAVGAEHG